MIADRAGRVGVKPPRLLGVRGRGGRRVATPPGGGPAKRSADGGTIVGPASAVDRLDCGRGCRRLTTGGSERRPVGPRQPARLACKRANGSDGGAFGDRMLARRRIARRSIARQRQRSRHLRREADRAPSGSLMPPQPGAGDFPRPCGSVAAAVPAPVRSRWWPLRLGNGDQAQGHDASQDGNAEDDAFHRSYPRKRECRVFWVRRFLPKLPAARKGSYEGGGRKVEGGRHDPEALASG